MQRVRLGRTGLQVSRIGIGGFVFGAVNRSRGWDPYSDNGRREALRTINHALNLGINYIDTAPAYGNGYSEALIGEVMRLRRDECVLATKVDWRGSDKDVTASVLASMARLQTDHLDLVQFHGGIFQPRDQRHILEEGPLDALRELQTKGALRFIGATTEEPFCLYQAIDEGVFDVVQLSYNFIYQAAALHVLPLTAARDVGVVSMRSMTSGILHRLLSTLAPDWIKAQSPYTVALRFVLGDPRVHVANVGMRWSTEVDEDVRIAESCSVACDVSLVPRSTVGVFQAEDRERTAP